MSDQHAAPDQPAPDQIARDRIASDLDATLFVEAGAGSGKTTALVTRVVALVTSGTAELEHVAAITFTEKAAAELRDRTRQDLERAAVEHDGTEVGTRCRVALDQLDSAAIGTLHSFAQRLLSEHPVEAGLPPRVEVLDEVTSGVDFERRWTAFRDRLLADPELERTLLLLLSTGIQPAALRALAQAFDQNWDLVAERVAPDAPEPPAVDTLLEAALAPIDAVCAERVHCHQADDKLRARLDDIADYAQRLREIGDEVDILAALSSDSGPKAPSFRAGNVGAQSSWAIDKKELQGRIQGAGDALAQLHSKVSDACAHRLGAAISRFTLAAAAERRAAGRLEFHDLLVLSRALLRDDVHGPVVRTRCRARYRHLLLDEFQDTDPIQIELAVRIAAADPQSAAAGTALWSDVDVAPGALFVVGDPKQSIYRFRRADIATFLAARARFGPLSGGTVELTANFRSARDVIDWVNHTFAALMSEEPDEELPFASQPDYVALDAVRPTGPVGPAVSVLGRAAHDMKTPADELRAAEANEVARAVVRALAEQWTVADDGGGWRPARLGDIAILVPARTSLPFLEDAFDAAGVPFRAESSSLVYATRAVRDLLMILRAVDDPTNHLHIVSALRTPLLACGDDDLFRFKHEQRGSWSYLAPPIENVPADADDPGDPVGAGLAYLRILYDARQWCSPSEMLDRIARDRRALELGFAEGRPRDVWRRIRFVIDQARAWGDATGGSLRQYLQWVGQQTAEGARVAESVLPETDDDAVRVMTIHAAKGLEFPVTIVSGLSTVPMSWRSPAEVVFPPNGTVGYRFGKHVATNEFLDWKPIDEQMGYDERIRLLYVACTRARDHLVVSLHRKDRRVEAERTKRTNAELLLAGMGELIDTLPDAATDAGATTAAAPAPVVPAAPPPFAAWLAERDAALARASRPTAVAATALTDEGAPDAEGEPDPGLQKRVRDLDLPPWLKGRYGTAVGRAVHGALQTIDLATGAGLDAAVAAQCEAEAVPDRADDVRRLARHALASPSVREAAHAPHWREVYACTPLGPEGRLLEGYVDLLYRTAAGLVVVDYKTSATDDAEELDRRVDGYRLQGASYAVAVAAATAESVVRVTFVFLTPNGAVERHLTDLDATTTEVNALVVAGREMVTA